MLDFRWGPKSKPTFRSRQLFPNIIASNQLIVAQSAIFLSPDAYMTRGLGEIPVTKNCVDYYLQVLRKAAW